MSPHSSAMQDVEQRSMRRLGKASRGGLAQLGEHLLCKQGVVGSIPSSSTKISISKHQETGALILAFANR